MARLWGGGYTTSMDIGVPEMHCGRSGGDGDGGGGGGGSLLFKW